MNNHSRTQQSDQTARAQSGNSERFDFDLWATEVKRQMLASLQKRGVK